MSPEEAQVVSASEPARVEELLRQHLRLLGMNLSRQRSKVVRSFVRAAEPITARELLYLVKKDDLFVSFGTVRNTLKTLVACGLAKDLVGPDGVTRYEHEHNPCTHRHLVCKDCGANLEEEIRTGGPAGVHE